MKPLLPGQPVTLEGARPSNELVQIIQDAARDISALRSDVDGAFPNGQLRARVNFNGTGTIAIREAANVASITDLGTGQYRVNFTTARPNANYTVLCSVSSFNTTVVVRLLATTSVQIEVRDLVGTLTDADTVCVAVFQ